MKQPAPLAACESSRAAWPAASSWSDAASTRSGVAVAPRGRDEAVAHRSEERVVEPLDDRRERVGSSRRRASARRRHRSRMRTPPGSEERRQRRRSPSHASDPRAPVSARTSSIRMRVASAVLRARRSPTCRRTRGCATSVPSGSESRRSSSPSASPATCSRPGCRPPTARPTPSGARSCRAFARRARSRARERSSLGSATSCRARRSAGSGGSPSSPAAPRAAPGSSTCCGCSASRAPSGRATSGCSSGRSRSSWARGRCAPRSPRRATSRRRSRPRRARSSSPGADVTQWPGLPAAIRDRGSVFAVGATLPGRLGRGSWASTSLQAADFGRGEDRRGYLAVFVPRGWLTVALGEDARTIADLRRRPAPRRRAGERRRPARSSKRSGGAGASMSAARGSPRGATVAAVGRAALAGAAGAARLPRRPRDPGPAPRRARLRAHVPALGRPAGDRRGRRLHAARQPGVRAAAGLHDGRAARASHGGVRASRRSRRACATEHRAARARRGRRARRDPRGARRRRGPDVRVERAPGRREGLIYAAARDITERRRAERALELLVSEQAALRRVATLVARDASPGRGARRRRRARFAGCCSADTTRLLRYEGDDAARSRRRQRAGTGGGGRQARVAGGRERPGDGAAIRARGAPARHRRMRTARSPGACATSACGPASGPRSPSRGGCGAS